MLSMGAKTNGISFLTWICSNGYALGSNTWGVFSHISFGIVHTGYQSRLRTGGVFITNHTGKETSNWHPYKGKYEAKIEQLSEEVTHLEKGLKAMDKQMEQHRALKRDSDSLRENRELTAALIDRLIDRVEVSKDRQITVRYRFESEFDSCEEVLNQCKNM